MYILQIHVQCQVNVKKGSSQVSVFWDQQDNALLSNIHTYTVPGFETNFSAC